MKILLVALFIGFFLSSCTKITIREPSVELDSIIFFDKTLGASQVFKDIEYNQNGKLEKFGQDHFFYKNSGLHSQTKEYIDGVLMGTLNFVHNNGNRLNEIIWTPATMSDGSSIIRRDRKYLYNPTNHFPISIERDYLGNSSIGLEQIILPSKISKDLQKLEYENDNVIEEIRHISSESTSIEITYKITNTFKYDGDDNVYKKLFGDVDIIPMYFSKFLNIDDYFLYSKNNVISITTGGLITYISYKYDLSNRLSEISSGSKSIHFYYKD